jgi:hypothetical protein
MIRVTGYETRERYTQIHWEQDVVEGMMGPLIGLGFLEQYMGAYGTSPEDTIDYLVADPLYDDIDVPPMDDPEAPAKIAELLRRVKGRIEWVVDKAQLISDMSLNDDEATQVINAWETATAEGLAQSVITRQESHRVINDRAAAVAASHQRRQEELLADEMMEDYKPPEPVLGGGTIGMTFVNGQLKRS